ncbi:thioredoxin [Staphylococcus condimenti]|uniref:Thioredoxin family protein n=1 Tax=Staphylococcus condimenti TaxID=70255 RepID=A0AB37H291_9STAP|nr:thioredoxin family protein [Staphylococcus condimenti]AMY04526.1 thiol reductase thioredoxin [Staphylococcus condimenti]PNZ58584.1 thioredoxin [Staphylococcus condimenti]QQS83676.1 thioredoxin family protein [Staphylococcus condimenti]QRP96276.1 thioredoxin family protein [Staphylococcus condimenti]VEG64073.1 putative thioredoxin [Staphylococcus condimenti]
MKTLESVMQFDELKQGKTVFMFTADWCVDCRFIKPRLPELEENHKNFTFVSVDREQFIDLYVELGIMGIPSFLVYENGEQVGSYVSKDRKTIEQIDEFINNI